MTKVTIGAAPLAEPLTIRRSKNHARAKRSVPRRAAGAGLRYLDAPRLHPRSRVSRSIEQVLQERLAPLAHAKVNALLEWERSDSSAQWLYGFCRLA